MRIGRRHIRPALRIGTLLLAMAAVAGFVLLQTGRGKLFSVQSGSMDPSIPKGSLVQVNRVPSDEIKVGDVITYVSMDKKSTITHRVTALLDEDPSGNSFVTKGDANAEADVPIEATSVIGRVERSVPNLGYGVDFIKQPLGLIAIIYIPALLIVINETKRLSAYYRRMRPYLLFGIQSRLFPERNKGHGSRSVPAAMIAITLVGIAGFSGTVLAQSQYDTTLTGNTITSIDLPEEHNPPEEETPPDSNTITCTNENELELDSTTNQSATSGDANVSDNTIGGSSTSGNVSNSSSTTVTIDIENTCEVPEHEPEAPLLPETNL